MADELDVSSLLIHLWANEKKIVFRFPGLFLISNLSNPRSGQEPALEIRHCHRHMLHLCLTDWLWQHNYLSPLHCHIMLACCWNSGTWQSGFVCMVTAHDSTRQGKFKCSSVKILLYLWWSTLLKGRIYFFWGGGVVFKIFNFKQDWNISECNSFDQQRETQGHQQRLRVVL